MDKSLFAKVRKIQITTASRVTDIFAGEYASVFKGQGMEFEEVREYQPGDEIRSIDWNVTARMDRPFVKEFREERELTVIFVADVSSSMDFASTSSPKRELLAELCAVLSFAAIKNNDKVGVLLFSDHIEKYIPPAKGKKHVLRVIRELLTAGRETRRDRRATHLGEALEYLARVQRKRAVCFVVSDFLGDGYERILNLLSRKHDLVAITIEDPLEKAIPRSGLMAVEDLESGESGLVDFSHPANVERFQRSMARRKADLKRSFLSRGIDTITIETGKDFIPAIIAFFKERERKVYR